MKIWVSKQPAGPDDYLWVTHVEFRNGFTCAHDAANDTVTVDVEAQEGGAAAWGGITGTLADQTDLQAALDAKSSTSHNHDAAYDAAGAAATALTSALAADPTATSDLTNDSGFITAASAPVQSVAGKTGAVTLAKADVGLANVDNTSDANKPVSSAQQTALNAKQATSEKGQANGYASLGADGKVPSGQLPAASGSDPWTYLRLTSDFTTTSATAVDITGLAFTPAANERYTFEATLMTRTATATVGPRPGVAWPTGMSDGSASIQQTSSATANVFANGNIAGSVLAPVGGLPTTTGSWPAFVWGMAIAGATPSGNIRLQLASETAGTTVTVKAGSFLRYRTVP